MSVLVVMMILFVGPAQALAQESAEDAVYAVEEDMRKAILDSDVETLADLWAPHFMVNAPRNVVVPDRDAVLGVFRDGIAAYETYEQSIEELRVTGTKAVVMGTETVVPVGDEAPHEGQTVHRRYTHVWEHNDTDDAWHLVARHAHITDIE